jgi:dipeptidyl aminopeptidase/acylaminoacyl peptidase
MRAWLIALTVALEISPTIAVGQGIPEAIIAEGVPPIPDDLDDAVERYRFETTASFEGWFAGRREVLVTVSVGQTRQVFLVEKPGGSQRQLTSMPGAVSWAYPRPHREQFVLSLDEGGGENEQFFLFDLRSGDLSRFTDGRSRHRSACWSHSGRLLALNSDRRNGKDQDLYVLDPSSRATARRLKQVEGAWQVADWSPDDRRVVAAEHLPDKGSRLHLIDLDTGADIPLALPPDRDGRRVGIWSIRWSKRGDALYWITDWNSEFDHLVRYDFATEEITPLPSTAIAWDVESYDLADDGRTIVLSANEEGLSRLHVLDGLTGRERPAPRLAAGRVRTLRFRPDSLEFAFQWECPQAPRGVYSYDLEAACRTDWVRPGPGSPVAGRAPRPELIRFPTFDRRMIPAFVRRPASRLSPAPHPVLIEIHGGPAAQYRPGFSALEDYLADELGIALIHPNVRGSSGYGRSYKSLDDGRRREDAVKDIGALLDWIAAQPDLDNTRIAVSGGSYGGYMVLASLIRYGDRLKAGIDDMGFSSFPTLLENSQGLDREFARNEIGDERDPAMAEFLGRISPLASADKIRRPLLVIHGSNDPRVSVAESERIVAAVRKNGVPVWFIRARGEGHGFARRENGVYAGNARVEFLKRFLLGRDR